MGISPLTKKIFVGELTDDGYMWKNNKKTDITEDFKRCVVQYCSESIEFEVDGVKFKATCERID